MKALKQQRSVVIEIEKNLPVQGGLGAGSADAVAAMLGPDAFAVQDVGDRPLPESEREKIALFCNVRKSAVIPALDARNIYDVPLQYPAGGLDECAGG